MMTTTTVHWAEFWPKLAITWVIIGEFDNFGQILAFNVISVKFLDCNVCIMISYDIAIHQLVQNYI